MSLEKLSRRNWIADPTLLPSGIESAGTGFRGRQGQSKYPRYRGENSYGIRCSMGYRTLSGQYPILLSGFFQERASHGVNLSDKTILHGWFDMSKLPKILLSRRFQKMNSCLRRVVRQRLRVCWGVVVASIFLSFYVPFASWAESVSTPIVVVKCANAAAIWWRGKPGVSFQAIDPGQAAALCEAAVFEMPGDGDAWAFLARAYRKAERNAEASMAADRAVQLGSVQGFWERGIAFEFGVDVEINHTKAADWYRKAGNQGHASAQYNLGWAYEKGKGVERDFTKAAGWYRKAAEQGDATAQNSLGWAYEKGKGVERDLAKAAGWYRKAADQGNAVAQRNLGVLYQIGKGVERDLAKAAGWYRKAADQGNADAQRNLGVLYEIGKGVERDLAKAAGWYRKAADQGNAVAQNNLGVLYDSGKGVERDLAKAAGWYRKAADQGDATAQYNLGIAYQKGEGVERDFAKAAGWYRKAADQGNADAQRNLGVLYQIGKGVERDLAKAVDWYRKAADQGDATAQNNLGVAYEKGKGVERDLAKAVDWYRKAAGRGNANAQTNLGASYVLGDGVERDPVRAARWFRKAADQGHARAQNHLGVLFYRGDGVEWSIPEAIQLFRRAAKRGDDSAQVNLAALYSWGEGVERDLARAVHWYRKAADQGGATAQRNLAAAYAKGDGVERDLASAAHWYRKAADQGDATAQRNLGAAYTNGDGVERNLARAAHWYHKAADQGDATAQRRLGWLYATGKGVRKDLNEAVRWFRESAKTGNLRTTSDLERSLDPTLTCVALFGCTDRDLRPGGSRKWPSNEVADFIVRLRTQLEEPASPATENDIDVRRAMHDDFVPQQIGFLEHPNPDIRRRAIGELHARGDGRSIGPIASRLRDDSAAVRAQAVFALADLGERGSVEPLVAVLHDDDFSIRAYAVEALTKLGEASRLTKARDASSSLRELLANGPSRLTQATAAAQVSLGESVEEHALIDLLLSPRHWKDTVDALVAVSDRRAVGLLIDRLKTAQPPDADRIAYALRRLGGDNVLQPILRHYGKDGRDVSNVIFELGDSAVRRIVAMYKKGELDKEVSRAAADMFSVLRISNHGAIEMLNEVLQEDDGSVSIMAHVMLGNARVRVSKRFLELFVSRVPGFCSSIGCARYRYNFRGDMAEVEMAISWVQDEFIKLLSDQDEDSQEKALVALDGIGDIRAADAIIPLLNHRVGRIRYKAINALYRLDDSRFFIQLVVQLIKRIPIHTTMKSLVTKAAKNNVNDFFQAFAYELDERSRTEIVESLVAKRLSNDLIIERFTGLLQDDDPDVRALALGALEMIGGPRVSETMHRLLHDALPATWEDEDSRIAVSLLGITGGERAVKPLIKLLSDRRLRALAADALGRLDDKRALKPLMELLDNAKTLSGEERAMVLVAALRLGSRQAEERFIQLFTAVDETMQPYANNAMSNLGRPSSDLLIDLLPVVDGSRRSALVQHLGRTGDSRAVEHLVKMLATEKTDRGYVPVREIASALGSLGGPQAVRTLIKLLGVSNRDLDWELDVGVPSRQALLGTEVFGDGNEAVRTTIRSRATVPVMLSMVSEATAYHPSILFYFQEIGRRGAYRKRLELLKQVWRWRYLDTPGPAAEILQHIEMLSESLPEGEEIDPHTLLFAAILAIRNKDYERAQNWVKIGWESALRHGIPLHVAFAVIRAELLAERGHLVEAHALVQGSIGYARQHLRPFERIGFLALLQAELLMARAFVSSKQGDSVQAIIANVEAERLLKTALRLNWINRSLFERLLWRITNIKRHDLKDATLETNRKSITLVNPKPRNIPDNYAANVKLQRHIEKALREGDLASYQEAQQEVERAALRSMPLPAMVKFADKGRQRDFDELISLQKRVRGLKVHIAALTSRKDGSRIRSKSGVDLRDLQRKTRRQEGVLRRFVRDLKIRQPDIAARWAKSPTDLNQLRDRLAPGTGILQYIVLDRESYAFVVRRDEVSIVLLDNLDGEKICPGTVERSECPGLLESVIDYRVALGKGKPGSADAERLGELFSRALVEPIKDHIEGLRDLAIVPNGVLHRLPWAALPWEDGYLVEDKALTILPTSSLVAAILAAPNEEPAGMLALGNPNSDLPSSEDEVKALKHLPSNYLPESGRREILIGDEATREAVLDRDLRGFMLHFAVHGEAGSMEKTQLVLAGRKGLTYNQILGLNIKGAPSVVLSACSAGEGKVLSGDQVHSLADAFLLAQARSVVYTLWPVGDRSTKELMGEFYRHLGKVTSVSAALALAQRDMIRKGHPPGRWAGFLVSEWWGKHNSGTRH